MLGLGLVRTDLLRDGGRGRPGRQRGPGRRGHRTAGGTSGGQQPGGGDEAETSGVARADSSSGASRPAASPPAPTGASVQPPVGSSTPTSSTCSVIGKRSKARSDRRRPSGGEQRPSGRGRTAPARTRRRRSAGGRDRARTARPSRRCRPRRGPGRGRPGRAGRADGPPVRRVTSARTTSTWGSPRGVRLEVGDRGPAPLDGGDHPGGADHPGQRHREQARPGVQVGHPVPRPGTEPLQHGGAEHGGRGRMDLPEHAGVDGRSGDRGRRRPTWSGLRRVRPFQTSPAATSGSPSRRCRPVSTSTTGSPPSGEASTSIWRAPVQRTDPTSAPLTPSVAIGHRVTASMSWLRWRRSPSRPSRSTAKATRVLHPSPPGAPSTASTTTRRSSPATRASCSATRSSLSRRWAGPATCWKSQPPHRPGPAWGQTGATRSGDGSRTSTASARRNEVVSEVIRARTRSPGRLWRTNTTRPSGPRATQPPPAAIAPTCRSTTSSGTVGGWGMPGS